MEIWTVKDFKMNCESKYKMGRVLPLLLTKGNLVKSEDTDRSPSDSMTELTQVPVQGTSSIPTEVFTINQWYT